MTRWSSPKAFLLLIKISRAIVSASLYLPWSLIAEATNASLFRVSGWISDSSLFIFIDTSRWIVSACWRRPWRLFNPPRLCRASRITTCSPSGNRSRIYITFLRMLSACSYWPCQIKHLAEPTSLHKVLGWVSPNTFFLVAHTCRWMISASFHLCWASSVEAKVDAV